MIENYDRVDVFLGVDVGKGEHHAVALDRAGKVLFDKALPNEEAKLRALTGKLKQNGQVLFVVDQPATIGALPIAVAQAEDVQVGYLPGLAMRRIADLHAGEAKTDARDAAIIAQAARSLPHALRSLQLADEQVAELSMLNFVMVASMLLGEIWRELAAPLSRAYMTDRATLGAFVVAPQLKGNLAASMAAC